MEDAGGDVKTIREQTGWMRGMDGKWRFEIDDSAMEYDRQTTNGAAGPSPLKDYIRHDALFAAYPELANAKMLFAELGARRGATYNPRTNIITINSDMRNAPESEIIHEVQHAIQGMEGFSSGASREYWERRMMRDGYSKRWNNSHQEMMPSELYRNTAGEIEARDAAARRRMTAEERAMLLPATADRNTVFVEMAGTASDYIPGTIEQDEVRQGIMEVAGMEPVAEVKGSEFAKGETDLVTQVTNFFNRIGGIVFNQQLGDVRLTKNGVKADIAHGIGRKKAAAFAAVPSILEQGKVIDYQTNWKGRQYDTAVVAAPITIGGENYLAGVVLTRNQRENNFYVHEVLLTEKGTTPFKTGGRNSDVAGGDVPSVISLLRQVQNVKEERLTELDGNAIIGQNKSTSTAHVQKSQGASFDELLEGLREGQEEYLGALARDENAPSGTRITPADAANEAKWRRLQNEEAPPERATAPITKRDLDELVQLIQDIASPVTTAREARFEESEGLVSAGTPKQLSTVQQKADEARSYFLRKMVDVGDSVNRIGKIVKDKYLYPYYNMARGSASAAVNMIQNEQTDIAGHTVGQSLNSIFDPIRAKGESYYNQFQIYLYDLHNIGRMSLVRPDSTAKIEAEAALREFDRDNPGVAQITEARLQRMAQSIDEEEASLAKERLRLLRAVNRADRMGNKPVFSYEFSADMSKERSDRLLREHPEFAQYRQQVREYIKNLMQYRVDSGLMTAEDAAFLEKYYPNYVPTFRNTEKKPGRIDRKNAQIGRTVGRASGGNQKLVPLHEALGKQTMQTVREGSKNRFGLRLLDAYRTDSEGPRKYILDAQEYDADFDPETFDQGEELRKNNTFVVIDGKKKYEITVDDSLFDAVKALYPDSTESNIWIVKAIRTGNNLFKSLVTGYNPTFMLRNTVRDIQTAGLYSRDGFAFLKNYPRALNEIRTNGSYWKQYQALGGSFSSVFDYQTGTVKKAEGKAAKLVAKMEALNMAMEQAPRLAEFMSVVKAGDGSMDNPMDAMHAAADVTVNFGRAGTLGKALNANFVPFLNPGIQGFDKLIRRVTETKGSREWAKLVVRAAVLGVAPTVLNSLLYSDDQDWDDLKDSDKDTNYIFKIGDGLWLKIPKGRELSILGMTADRIQDIVNGEDVDWSNFITTVGNQVAPANPLRQNILAAWFDTDLFNESSPGRTWYGGDIESQRLQGYAPGERYESSTDVFSKWLGEQLDLSPKKINYLLDQYSGVVGDFFLPLLTPQAERNMFAKAFTIDSVSSNRLSGEFYDTADKLTYAKNSGDTTAKILSRFWSKQQEACSAIYAQIRDIEESDDLSNKEKKEQVREAKAILNGIQKNALAVLDTYKDSVEAHLTGDSDEEIEAAYREANNECFGAEYALQAYSKDTYANAQQASENGVGYDEFYAYYFDTKGYAKKEDKSIVTQKVEYLQQSEFSEDVKAEIYFADLASDSDLKKQAELETSHGITAVQYWQYKVATLGMTKKVEKLEAIDNLNLTQSQKTALYYANGYAESTLDDAPWIVGTDRWIGPDITPKLSVGKIDKPNLLG